MTRSAQTLGEVLAACLDAMQAGVTSAECLARYPEYADQLGPALLAAEHLQNQVWPTLSTSGRVRGRERMHAALASRRPAGFAWWSVLKPFSVAVMLLVLAAGVWLAWPGRQQVNNNLQTPAPALLPATSAPTGTFGATPTPTDTLTPTPTGTAGQASPTSIATGSSEMFEEPGEQMIPWATATARSDNTPTAETEIGTPQPTRTPARTPGPDGTSAPTIEVTEPRPARETPSPSRTPEPSRTAAATAAAATAAVATEEPHTTATRGPTTTRQPTETPHPTNTATKAPAPSHTPRPSPTVEPTEPPHATATRAATNTPAKAPTPSNTPRPTSTPRPSPTSEPTELPHATATRAATKTPEPLATPEPTKTPRPSVTHEPTEHPETPEATKTPDHD